VLLDEPHSEADEVIEAHRWLHDTAPFDVALLDRWLEIFGTFARRRISRHDQTPEKAGDR